LGKDYVYNIIYLKGRESMAKLVKVRFGLGKLSEKEYIYMANDNVKKGTVLMPTVNRWPQHGPYSTMGVVQGTLNMNVKQNQELVKQNVFDKDTGELNIAKADKISREELNKINPQLRDESGKFAYTGNAGRGITGSGRAGTYAFGFDQQLDRNNPEYQKLRTDRANERQEDMNTGKTQESFSEYASKYFKE
jgi:hypothetical protein